LMENFAHTYEQIAVTTPVSKVIVSSPGELLGLKGHIINWVARNVKRIVPKWNIDHIGFKQALAIGQKRTFHKPTIELNDIAFCNTPVELQVFLRVQYCFIEISCQM